MNLAHAELADPGRARAWQQAAREAGDEAAARRAERRLELYRRGAPCRQPWADDELAGFALPTRAPAR